MLYCSLGVFLYICKKNLLTLCNLSFLDWQTNKSQCIFSQKRPNLKPFFKLILIEPGLTWHGTRKMSSFSHRLSPRCPPPRSKCLSIHLSWRKQCSQRSHRKWSQVRDRKPNKVYQGSVFSWNGDPMVGFLSH